MSLRFYLLVAVIVATPSTTLAQITGQWAGTINYSFGAGTGVVELLYDATPSGTPLFGHLPAAGEIVEDVATTSQWVDVIIHQTLSTTITLPLPTFSDGSTACPDETAWVFGWGPAGTQGGRFDHKNSLSNTTTMTYGWTVSYSSGGTVGLDIVLSDPTSPQVFHLPLEVTAVAVRTTPGPVSVENMSFGRLKAQFRR